MARSRRRCGPAGIGTSRMKHPNPSRVPGERDITSSVRCAGDGRICEDGINDLDGPPERIRMAPVSIDHNSLLPDEVAAAQARSHVSRPVADLIRPPSNEAVRRLKASSGRGSQRRTMKAALLSRW